MKQDSRERRLLSLLSSAKTQLSVARIAGYRYRHFREKVKLSIIPFNRTQLTRHRQYHRIEARCARRLAKRYLKQIDEINVQLFSEGIPHAMPLKYHLDGRTFQTWEEFRRTYDRLEQRKVTL